MQPKELTSSFVHTHKQAASTHNVTTILVHHKKNLHQVHPSRQTVPANTVSSERCQEHGFIENSACFVRLMSSFG